MPERNDEQLDAMLREFLTDSLGPQQGRSERHFRRFIDGTARAAWKRRTWLIGAFITGMAASVAALWASPLFRTAAPEMRQLVAGSVPQQSQDSPAPSTSSGQAESVVPAVERVVQSQTTDEGVVLFDQNTPVRVLHRQQLEQTRWFDGQDKVQAEQITPKDDLVFVKMPTY